MTEPRVSTAEEATDDATDDAAVATPSDAVPNDVAPDEAAWQTDGVTDATTVATASDEVAVSDPREETMQAARPITPGTTPLADPDAEGRGFGGTAPLSARRPDPVPEGMEWDEVPTQVLPPPNPQPLAPLPYGAIVADKYVLRGPLSQDEEQNVYRAESFAGGEFYTIVESAEQYARGNQQVISQGLSHPHLLPVIDLVTARPYGDQPRYYAVSPAAQESIPLSEVATPQPIPRALAWANELAEAVGYLHEQGVYGPVLSPDNLLIENDHVLIADLGAAQVDSEADGEHDTLRRQDVANLARTVTFVMSGNRNATFANLPLLQDSNNQPLPQPIQDALGPALRGEQPDARAFAADLLAAWRSVAAPPTDMLLHSGKMTHIGMVRRNNQDSLAAMECVMMVQSLSGTCGIYVVADGMGGHKAGEVASAITVNAVVANLLSSTIAPLYSDDASEEIVSDEVARERISEAIEAANQQVHAMRQHEGTDMGTTCVAALVMDGRLYIGNVGDSRAYFYRPGVGISQMTSDHSLVARLVELGQISLEEAATHPHRHVIFRSLGEKQRVEVDTFAETLQVGDRVLLCSDGLSGMVDDEQIAAVLASEPDPQAAAQHLVELANAHGGVDNTSVVIVNVEQAVMVN